MSDNTRNYFSTKNVKFIKKSISEVRTLANEKLGFKVNIDFPYKLCDFKPAYGFIFSEFIKGYDFWGHSDIDIIFGNIRYFMNSNVLDNFDYISVRHDYTTGCFSLYKNNGYVNNLFTHSCDYKKVFTSNLHFCFDECNFVQDLLTEGKSIFEVQTEIESFTHVVKKAVINNKIKAHFDFILMEGLPGKIKFENGKIIFKNEFEAILYHLFWLKRVYTPNHIPRNIPNKYFISPTRIYF